jgi:hypothetical protein
MGGVLKNEDIYKGLGDLAHAVAGGVAAAGAAVPKIGAGGVGATGIAAAVGGAAKAASPEAQVAQLKRQVAQLTKLVHILWKEAEKLEEVVQVTRDGLRIKSGMSELLVLKNGGIILNGLRIHLKTPAKDQLLF